MKPRTPLLILLLLLLSGCSSDLFGNVFTAARQINADSPAVVKGVLIDVLDLTPNQPGGQVAILAKVSECVGCERVFELRQLPAASTLPDLRPFKRRQMKFYVQPLKGELVDVNNDHQPPTGWQNILVDATSQWEVLKEEKGSAQSALQALGGDA